MHGLGDPQKLVAKLGYSLSKRSDQLMGSCRNVLESLKSNRRLSCHPFSSRYSAYLYVFITVLHTQCEPNYLDMLKAKHSDSILQKTS